LIGGVIIPAAILGFAPNRIDDPWMNPWVFFACVASVPGALIGGILGTVVALYGRPTAAPGDDRD
jgi:hypothetical protein